jgi:hypothetical protein
MVLLSRKRLPGWRWAGDSLPPAKYPEQSIGRPARAGLFDRYLETDEPDYEPVAGAIPHVIQWTMCGNCTSCLHVEFCVYANLLEDVATGGEGVDVGASVNRDQSNDPAEFLKAGKCIPWHHYSADWPTSREPHFRHEDDGEDDEISM